MSDFGDWDDDDNQSPIMWIFVLAGIAAAGAIGVFAIMWLASLLQELGR